VERILSTEDLDLESIRTELSLTHWKELGLTWGQYIRMKRAIKEYKVVVKTRRENGQLSDRSE